MKNMLNYSTVLQEDNHEVETCAHANFDKNPCLMLDVILIEVRSYTMRYTACKRREENRLIQGIKAQIHRTAVDLKNLKIWKYF